MPVAERSMLKHINEVVELNLVIISLLIELVKHADNFFEEGKKKHLPSTNDLNPNRRFVENEIITLIRSDNALIDKVSRVSGIWLKNDHDVVRKLFSELFKSELYSKYKALVQPDTIKLTQELGLVSVFAVEENSK